MPACATHALACSMIRYAKRSGHPAGERLFVDYAGHTIDVIDPLTGEVRTAQLFVATLGASSYTFAEATWTQSLPDWIASHVRAFDFIGGVTAQVVSDNLKAGVTKACFYDPAINGTYADMPAITTRPLCLRGRTNPRTRPRSRGRSCWSNAGSWRDCAIVNSSASQR
jgi:hypothetical protein